jgi:hypothetical protein
MTLFLRSRRRRAGLVAGALAMAAAPLALAAPLVSDPSVASAALLTSDGSAAPPAPSQTLLDQMAQAKADTDLGNHEAAIRALSAVIDAAEVTPALRAEARVRLGVARRGAGDLGGAAESFEEASKDPGLGIDTKALLVQALGGALPGADRWAEVWSRVAFAADRSTRGRPTLAIVWPDVPSKQVYRGRAVTLQIEDGSLYDLFRLVADISGLNVVVNPGVNGRFTLSATDEPWDGYLHRVLEANGLAYWWEDNVLWITQPQHLPRPRHYSGQRIDVDWSPDADARRPGRGRDLKEALAEVAAAGGATVWTDPAVQGGMILKLNDVRWDQAFDIVVGVNALEWTREGTTLRVFPRKGSAKSR